MFPANLLERCAEFSEAIFLFGVNALLQSTLLIALGLAIGRAVRSKGAAVQSAVYRVALATALVCPVVSLLLAALGAPGMYFNLSVIPRFAGVQAWKTAPANTTGIGAERPADASAIAALTPETLADRSKAIERSLDAPGAASADQRWDVGEGAKPTLESSSANSSFAWRSLFIHGFVGAWFLGTSLLLARLYFGWRSARWLRRTASPADPRTVTQCQAFAQQLGIRAPSVLRTPFSASPLLMGMMRPVVLLSDDDGAVSTREVLAHELAHLVRGDIAWGLAGRAGIAIWFFQPLMWLLVRRMVVSAEEVCDDYVLDLGLDRLRYARQLIDVAQRYHPTPSIAVGMIALRSWVGRRVTRILDPSRQFSLHAGRGTIGAASAVSLVATIFAGLIGIGGRGSNSSAADLMAGSTLAAVAAQQAVQAQTPREITVRGKVVSPGGQPVAGAIVRAAVNQWAMLKPILGPNGKLPAAEARTDAGGEFTVSFTTQPYGDLSHLDRRWQEIWKETNIAASAPGYGPAWVKYKDIPPDRPLTLQLVPDLPIQGRVVGAEGKPVVGLDIDVGQVYAAKNEDLTPWLAGIKAGQLPWVVVDLAPREIEPAIVGVPTRVKTDSQGRFEIRGIGCERHLDLAFKGQAAAYREFGVVTRRMEEIQSSIMGPWNGHPASKEPIYGAEFVIIAAASRPSVGIVRDAKTRKPLAGVSVESYTLAGYPFANARKLKTTTDAEGRYRLVGMPSGKGNSILAIPKDDQPYLMRRVELPDPEGAGPVSADVDLHRGIWITGRVTEKASGEPVRAYLHYLPFRTNPFAKATPEFGKNFNADGDQLRYESRADGSYRLVGLPGRAIVGAQSMLRQYRSGVGSDKIQGFNPQGHFDTYANPIHPGLTWPNVMKEIGPPAEAESITLDLQMDSGLTMRVAMVDADGKPIRGVTVDGIASSHGRQWTTVDEPTLEVTNLAPGESRTLLLHQEARKLGLVAHLKVDESRSQPVTVRLLPVGAVRGRLFLRDGTPANGANVEALVLPTRDFGNSLPPVMTDAQGRFEYTLLPSAKYRLKIEGGKTKVDFIEGDLSVNPNQVKDLGDVTLGRQG